MSNELVSIIIPVYNCEKYLKDCLSSVVNQSYKNIEVVLVDDESTDKSGEICDRFADQYSFIRVIHQKNAGSGLARNTGLGLIKGDYYTFVDADDYISKTFVQDMLSVSKEYNAELIECGNVYMLEARNILRNVDRKVYKLSSTSDIKEHAKDHRNTVWGRLYRRDVFGHIRFSDKRLGEDAEYSQIVIDCCKSMVHYNYCLYGYRSYQESVTRSTLSSSVIEELKAFVVEKQYTSFEEKVKKTIEPIIHRREEKLYSKKLQKVLSIYKNVEGYSEDTRLYCMLHDAVDRGRCNFYERVGLVIRHTISQIVATYRTKTNYMYKLDVSK